MKSQFFAACRVEFGRGRGNARPVAERFRAAGRVYGQGVRVHVVHRVCIRVPDPESSFCADLLRRSQVHPNEHSAVPARHPTSARDDRRRRASSMRNVRARRREPRPHLAAVLRGHRRRRAQALLHLLLVRPGSELGGLTRPDRRSPGTARQLRRRRTRGRPRESRTPRGAGRAGVGGRARPRRCTARHPRA
jgi:hypothetical protein